MFEASAVLASLMIFFARVIDVSVGTLRVIVLVRGKKRLAASLGFVESIVYVLALGFVVGRLNNPLNIVMYGLGFALGNIVGGYIEERMAMGYTIVQIISMSRPWDLCCHLREMGFGVTSWEGEGRDGKHLIMSVAVARKELQRLLSIIDEWDERAFITVLDARTTKGGFLYTYKKRQKHK